MQSRGEIDSFIENHTTTTVSFTVSMKSVQLKRMTKTGLEKAFGLNRSMLLTNMNAFDSNNRIQKYESPEDIVHDYFPVRLGLYHDRKKALECSKEYSAELTRNKARFIERLVDGKVNLVSGNKSKIDTVLELEELGFSKVSSLEKILQKAKTSKSGVEDDSSNDDAEASDVQDDATKEGSELKDYDYLLNLPLSSLTSERIDSLRDEADKTDSELVEIRQATPENLWHDDLNKLDDYLEKKMKL